MYVIGTDACSLPNSQSPMSQAAIDAETAFGNSVGSAFEDGDATLNDLITALGGNPAGATSSGSAGVATTGTLDTDTAGIPVVSYSTGGPSAALPDINDPSTWGWAPSPVWHGRGGYSSISGSGGSSGGSSGSGGGSSSGSGGGGSAPTAATVVSGGAAATQSNTQQGEQSFRNSRRYRSSQSGTNTWNPPFSEPPSNCPQVVPLVTAITVPTVATTAPATPAPATVSAPAPPAPAPAPPASPIDCRTGNYCLDIMQGCVLSSQVSPQQLLICSQAGYVGNENLFPAIAAAGGVENGEYFGTPEPNPPPYTPGMSGFGQDDSAVVQTANAAIFGSVLESLITAAATAGALAILWKQRRTK